MKQLESLPSLSDPERVALTELLRLLQQRFGNRLRDVMLYGSKARGDFQPNSDVDVLVLLDHPSATDLRDAGGLGFDVWLATGVFLSLHIVDSAYWVAPAGEASLFARNVMRDGLSLIATIV